MNEPIVEASPDAELEPLNLDEAAQLARALHSELGRVIVGQHQVIAEILTAFLAGGHCLLRGVPGLAKTLLIKTLAQAVHLKFSRNQFTPDLMPSDILGTEVIEEDRVTGSRSIRFIPGPLFANIILADEINRSPAKVQSALLESMQERQVTIGEETFPLEEPFLVLATQNPIEQEGTYPLPEAQVDRFMLKIKVDYPSREEELEIMRRMARTGERPRAKPVVTPGQILLARAVLNDLYIDERVEQYIVDLVMASRMPARYKLESLVPLVQYGASPRASINLNLAARAHAFLQHRAYVTPEDVRSVALDVMRHRIATTYEAEAEEITSDELTTRILETVEVP